MQLGQYRSMRSESAELILLRKLGTDFVGLHPVGFLRNPPFSDPARQRYLNLQLEFHLALAWAG